MADRLNSVRRLLYDALVERNVKGTWEHIIKQKGSLVSVQMASLLLLLYH